MITRCKKERSWVIDKSYARDNKLSSNILKIIGNIKGEISKTTLKCIWSETYFYVRTTTTITHIIYLLKNFRLKFILYLYQKLHILITKKHVMYKKINDSFNKPATTKMALPKHIPSVTNGWNNASYMFDKNKIVATPARDRLASNLVKSYLSSVIYERTRKSKRMKDLIRRSSTKQIFVSNVEVKQTNNRTVVTVYVFDRYRQILAKKIFSLLMYLNAYKITNKYFIYNNFWNKKYQDYSLLFRYFNPYYHSLIGFNRINIDMMVKFDFVRWAFSLFGIIYKLKRKKLKLNKKFVTQNQIVLIKNNQVIYNVDHYFKRKLLWCDLPIINNKLLQFFYSITGKQLDKNLSYNLFKYRSTSDKGISLLQNMYKHYSIYYLKNFLRKNFSIHYYAMVFYDNLNFAKFKTNKGIFYMQSILSKIYNRNVILNIVFLKYLHLNVNILIQAMAVKLKNKKNRVLNVLKKSLKLGTISKSYKNKLKIKSLKSLKLYKKRKINLTFINLLGVNKGLNIYNTYHDVAKLDTICSLLFIMNKKDVYKNVKKTLKNLKYKRLTGIWLEAKGRLTKRYTASRALHKVKHKGSLQNYEHHMMDLTRNKPSTIMMRGLMRPNVQHSFVTSKKRIGAFGIKGWISSN